MICLCYKHLTRYVYPLKKICKKARYHAFPSISKIFVGFSNIKQRLLICCCLVIKRNNTVLQKLETYPAKDASFIETNVQYIEQTLLTPWRLYFHQQTSLPSLFHDSCPIAVFYVLSK